MRRFSKSGMPKVALVRGPIISAEGSFNNEATPAIGLAYVAGTVQAIGCEVEIVDAIGEGLNRMHPLPLRPGFVTVGLTIEELVDRVPEDADVIGVSGMFSGEWPAVRAIIESIRARLPGALIVAGGEHVTSLPEYSLRDCPALDLVVKGEGEATFAGIVEAYRSGGDFSALGGVCFLDSDGGFVDNGSLPRVREIDTIARPYWPDGYLEKFWNQGKSHGVLTARDMPMLASRGCPYQCTFCSSPSMWTTRYVLRDIDDLIDEIKDYIRRFDITAIQFYDLTAITKKRWIVAFCKRLTEEGIDLKWSLPSGTRSEALDEETLTLMQEANCNYLVYAPESGSADTLEAVQKRITVEAVTRSIRTAKRVGLVLRANMVIGFPHERRRQIYETLWYGLKLSAYGVDEVAIFLFSAYPGSQIFRELHAQGRVRPDDGYFFGLTSLNAKFNTLTPKTYNDHVPAIELAVYRTAFMMANYVVGYLCFPSRILRTLANVFGGGEGHQATTVLEHRIRDAFSRRKARRQARRASAG